MAGKRKPGNNFKPFESITSNAKHIRITNNMIDSKAWQDLSIHARYLYLEFKRAYDGSNEQTIQFTFSYGRSLMEVRTFSRALDELINHGFITVQYNGRASRQPSQYAFSDAWKRWPEIKTISRIYTMPADDKKDDSADG